MRTFRIFKTDGDSEDVQADYYELVAYEPITGGKARSRYFLFIHDATRLTDYYILADDVLAISLIR